MNEDFIYKDIRIATFPNVEKITTDTVFLADIAADLSKNALRTLEVGSGTGLIALSMAQLSEHVDAIDVNEHAVQCSRYNFLRSSNSDKLLAIQADYKTYLSNISKGYYQMIVCNPPYHETAKEYRSVFRQLAREEKSFDLPYFIHLSLQKSRKVVISIPEKKYTSLIIHCYAYIPYFKIDQVFQRSSVLVCVFGLES